MSTEKTTADNVYRDDLTIVTAFINIGDFQKGPKKVFTPGLYRQWSSIFARINNSIVAFFDNQTEADLFRKVRSGLPAGLTKIIVVPRTELWAFQSLGPRIADIYSNPSYPRHHPNTVVPEYASVMHAKYEFVLRALSQNPFRTRFFAWLDIGYFRDLQRLATEKVFKLHPPPSANTSCVSYQLIHGPENVTAQDIFLGNKVWVGGGFFVGVAAAMATWAEEYRRYANYFACQGLMNTDQQVIYAAFHGNRRPASCIDTHAAARGYPTWISLGYLSID